MFKYLLSIFLVASLVLASCKGKKKSVPATKIEDTAVQTTSFGVRGNCGMCKKTIETAAMGVAGVASAVWDKATKQIAVKFTGDVLEEVHTAIAASGYDTYKATASDEAYNSRPKCCQYDRSMDITKKACCNAKTEKECCKNKQKESNH